MSPEEFDRLRNKVEHSIRRMEGVASISYKVIEDGVAKEIDATHTECILLHWIEVLSNDPVNPYGGWCFMRHDNLAKEIGVSKNELKQMLDKFIRVRLIIRHPTRVRYKPTEKYYNDVDFKE